MLETSVQAITSRIEAIARYPYTRAEADKPLDGFEGPELEMARTLQRAFEIEADEAQLVLQGVLQGLRVNPQAALDAIEDATQNLNNVFGETEARTFTAAVGAAVTNGGEIAGADSFAARNALRVRPLYEGMVESAKYATNTYFNRVVLPSLEYAIQALVETPGSDSLVGFEDIRSTMAARLKSVPYWRTVANSAASRAYHWGAITAGVDAGFMTYTLRAVIDSRTTAYCRSVNGYSYQVRDAQDWVQRVAVADIAELKSIAPWATKDDDERTLSARGHIVPPFHGNCRTTIQLYR